METTKTCEWCEGKGFVEVPNGPDDFEHNFCGCEKGKALELENDA